MSAKAPDLTGQTFGRWLVLSPAESDSRGRARYLCRCSCGRERVVLANNLRRGVSTSCGCATADVRREDLTSQTFGRLTALRHVGARGGNPIWLCRCECGREREVAANNLKGGHTVSCGCATADATASGGPIQAARQSSPLTGKFETNHRAKHFCIERGGRTWHFRNMLHFVRQHAEMFGIDPEVDSSVARVARGLYDAASRSGSWCGWRVSHDDPPSGS